jgi:histone-lysine N-methyltransferase SETD2
MEDEDQIPKNEEHSPDIGDPLPTKSEPSTSTSPKPESTPPASKKPLKKGPQLIGNLPVATEEAMKTFLEIRENHYQYSTLGRSREALESMTCECPPSGSGESLPLFLGWG